MIDKNEFDGRLKYGNKIITGTGRNKYAELALQFRESLVDSNDSLKKNVYNLRDCPVCNSSDSTIIFKKLGFEHVRCSSCDMIYTKQVLKEDILKDYHKSHNLTDAHHLMIASPMNEELDILRFDYCLDIILSKVNNIHKVLDIGCGLGVFLERSKKRGMDITGIELNEYASNVAREKGIKIYNDILENIKFNKKFDMITLWNVLEHIVCPREFLTCLTRNLNDKGLLVIEIPNINGFATMLLREKSTTFGGDQHVNFFSLKGLNKFLSDFSYDNIHAQTYISEIMTAINYLDYQDPYTGQTPSNKFSGITPEWINSNMMGHRLFCLYQLEKNKV
ncbi:MAG: class I SAM-dependent methyltransferase [Candidatus Omnitrophica bacterium]|nr:class I SAM-dependent methyltransferase [Candidatus Omnitrophota bacterium]